MGDRYILIVVCPNCSTEDDDVYYAPTCGFLSHTCSQCGTVIDLEKFTGISAADASNVEVIEAICKVFYEGDFLLPFPLDIVAAFGLS